MSLIDFKNLKIAIDEEQLKRIQAIAKAAVPVLVVTFKAALAIYNIDIT